MQDDNKAGFALLWGEYKSGRDGTQPVQLKGDVDAPCFSVIRRNLPGVPRSKIKFDYHNDPHFRVWFEEKRGTSKTAIMNATDDASLALAIAPEQHTQVNQQQTARSSRKLRGHTVIYTEESYKRTHNNRTYQEDGRKLVKRPRKDGTIEEIIPVWEGDTDVWIQEDEDIEDATAITTVSDSRSALDSDETATAFANLVPEISRDLADATRDSAPDPYGSTSVTVTPPPLQSPHDPPAAAAGAAAAGAAAAPQVPLTSNTPLEAPAKKKRIKMNKSELDAALHQEHLECDNFSLMFQFGKCDETVPLALKTNLSSLMQPLNATGRMDDIVSIVDWNDTLDKTIKLIKAWKKITTLAPSDLLKLSNVNMQTIIAFKAMVPELDDALSGGVPLETVDGSKFEIRGSRKSTGDKS